MRGEYPKTSPPKPRKPELPPHARRIPDEEWRVPVHEGTTSACAENTQSGTKYPLLHRNYLRMRGEYRNVTFAASCDMELPPHARRIHPVQGKQSCRLGTTSACAENTALPEPAAGHPRNYLRMRGEYSKAKALGRYYWELPPHARRILRLR